MFHLKVKFDSYIHYYYKMTRNSLPIKKCGSKPKPTYYILSWFVKEHNVDDCIHDFPREEVILGFKNEEDKLNLNTALVAEKLSRE